MSFLALFVSLPTKAATGRMRVWRALKAQGCATLRDGVYLLPDAPEHAAALNAIAIEAQEVGGSAEIYCLSGSVNSQEAVLRALFDRSEDYAAISEEARVLLKSLTSMDGASIGRQVVGLTRRFEQVVKLDFYAGEAQRQVLGQLDALRAAVSRLLSPDEPTTIFAEIPRLHREDYRGRTWVTRARPWVDRLACAWLIKKYIDRDAKIIWLSSISECRAEWLGFDFDGATFSHVGTKVSFEVLLTSFGLDDDAALVRLGELVHCLDAGGLPIAEAPGVEATLSGLRATVLEDDALLAQASKVFDWLMQYYREKPSE
ncbi:MAG: chromate resistance protein [Gammaproteobacteria bacterium]|nr:chromate resistance protein [Gammaproteobacteria bacterium]